MWIWFHWNGVSSEDTHQCFSHWSCGLNKKCLNTDGSIICECNTGYILNKSGCADINECDSDDAYSENFTYENTSGKNTCSQIPLKASKNLMASVLILTNGFRQIVTNMLHVQMHQVLSHVLVKLSMKLVYLCPKKCECFNNRGSFAWECKSDTPCIVITRVSMSMNVLMKYLVISRHHRAWIRMVDSKVNVSMSSTKRKMVHALTSMNALKICYPRADCVDLSGSFECSWRMNYRNGNLCWVCNMYKSLPIIKLRMYWRIWTWW